MTDYANTAGGRCGRRGLGWHPVELIAMVLGFILFWPVGLAILFLKMWQRKSGRQGDLVDAAQTAYQQTGEWARGKAQGFSAQNWTRPAQSAWTGPRATGNTAFDDWRASELAKLEEARRKVIEAEREFADHIDGLRRSRDREEFERFMQSRGNPPANTAQ